MLAMLAASPIFFVLFLVTRRKLVRVRQENTTLLARLKPISSIEAQAEALRGERTTLEAQIDATRATYKEKRALLDNLSEQVAVYDERLAFAELGVYEPHFDFTDSEAYKDANKA